MDYEGILSKLTQNKIAVLAGAGISYNSGLPHVNAFYNYALPLLYDHDDALRIRSIISNPEDQVPFERFMEHVFSYTEQDYTLMDIFSKGSPNVVHMVLAKMLQEDWADTLYTTNFDRLIECALDKIGFGSNYDFLCDEEGFKRLNKNTKVSKKLVKIHGTIENKETIRTTLMTITSSHLLSARKIAVDHLFKTGNHDVLLVLGYSFSDRFDISHFLSKMDVTKEIVVISHTSGVENAIPKPIQELTGNNPFRTKDCTGYVLEMDTTLFVKSLYASKFGEHFDISPEPYKWEAYLDNWISKYEKNRRDYIAGSVANSLTDFELGNKYTSRAFEETHKDAPLYLPLLIGKLLAKMRTMRDQTDVDPLLCECYEALAMLEKKRGLFTEEYITKQKKELNYRVARLLESGKFDYTNALRKLYSVYRMEYRDSEIEGMSATLHQIGINYSKLNNPQMALKCFRKSIRYKKHIGYYGGVLRTYIEIATCYIHHGVGDSKKLDCALRNLKRAESYLHAGEPDLRSYYWNLKSLILIAQEKWVDAKNQLEDDLINIPQHLGRKPIATAKYNLSRCLTRLGEFSDAVSHLDFALKYAKDFEDFGRQFRCNQELAMAHLLLGHHADSLLYLFNNIKLLHIANEAEKGYYFFYVSMFFLSLSLLEEYAIYVSLSKKFFSLNGTAKQYYRLKNDFINRIPIITEIPNNLPHKELHSLLQPNFLSV